MKLSVLGSGSRGNAFALSAEGITILLDAGFPARTLQRRAGSVGIDLSRISAVVLTHEHADHAEGAMAVALAADCPVYASRGTLEAMGPERGATWLSNWLPTCRPSPSVRSN